MMAAAMLSRKSRLWGDRDDDDGEEEVVEVDDNDETTTTSAPSPPATTTPSPPWRIHPPSLPLCFMGELPFHIQRNPSGIKQKQKKSIFIYGTTLRKTNLFRDFQRVQIYSIAHKNKKRITAVTHYKMTKKRPCKKYSLAKFRTLKPFFLLKIFQKHQ